ncbi:Hint domain-containing protein [Mycoplana dimorpha]|uniref:Hint domain-containing protein n=1 Tax=Mycoplana dimorpha TaxID=28320 RepID=A0A2T5AID5_MYCDI|nr:Hint domain-containing protein [Mycoplana dimorpha]PTM86479.1 Hint domain-containing protein [Mycoplana dimorpha]
MSHRTERRVPLNRARRHFLGLAAATGARIAGLGVLGGSIISTSTQAAPKGKAWGWYKNHGACFLPGTSILTSKGEVPIEDIRAGDLVQTIDGGVKPVRWVGHRAYKRSGPTWHPNIAPIRIVRHCLDGQTPHRDLYISIGHALYMDGALIEARYLLNGRTIAPTAPNGTIEYFNILLDSHDVIFAEGVPVETFCLANGNHQQVFSNFAELDRLMPSAPQVAMASFAPRLRCSGRDHLKALLAIMAHPFSAPSDPIAEARERIAARVLEVAR